MLIKNQKIYNIAMNLMKVFNDENLYLPMKLNFYIQKNKKTFIELGQDIESARMKIAAEYGVYDEATGQYSVPPEKVQIASKELNDLFNLEQEVNIYKIKVEDLPSDLNLTTAQMDAILFMIED